MIDLAAWLATNLHALIQAAVDELTQDTTQRAQVVQTVEAFFGSLQKTVESQDQTPLNERMEDWVAGRSAPTESELASLVPVLISIKQANYEQIRLLCSPDEAINYVIELDDIYSRAINYLSKRETDVLIGDMRAQLRQAQAQLERLDKSKSDFVAVAAHELRTPITLVEGYANMMRLALGDVVNDPSVGPMVDGVESGIKRLREIIRDMLDVSIISLDMIELHLQPTWLHQIIDAVERNTSHQLTERDLELVIDRDTIPRQPIYADPERLIQVFQKIVSNAIKYTPDGGIITVEARELTGFTDITVIDNGIGISANDLNHIFGMFSSLGDSALHSSGKTKFRGGGPGLGLFISKGIIEAHGGNIWVESPGYDEVNCPGSAFHVVIPMRSAPQDDKIGSKVFNQN